MDIVIDILGATSLWGRRFIETIVIAVPAVLVWAWVGGYLYRRFLDWLDRGAPGRKERIRSIAKEFGLPPAPDPNPFDAPEWRDLRTRLEQTLHAAAIRRKNRYYENIGRCGALLTLMFLILALSVTVLATNEVFQRHVPAAELAAILLVVWFWWRSRIASKSWVRSRAHTELMRQWRDLTLALGRGGVDLNADFDRASEAVGSVLAPPEGIWGRLKQWIGVSANSKQIEDCVANYWAAFQTDAFASAPAAPPPNDPRLVAYLHKRVLGQLDWFQMRRAQMLKVGDRRGLLALSLFAVNLALAVAGAWYSPLLNSDASRPELSEVLLPLDVWLAFALLVTTAISAATTYWFLSRNARSLRHRYETQRRSLSKWLEVAAAELNAPSAHLYAQIRDFENLMVDELIDWIHITSHDVAELSA